MKRLRLIVSGRVQYDAIIHLAGLLGTHELWDTAEDAIDVNIKGALNIARLALEHDAKLVSIEQPHIWFNVYEATKFAARRMLTGLAYDKGLRVDFVTAHNAFGPGQAHGPGHPQKLIPTFATKAWAGEPVPVWGDGKQKVNLVYAGDIADLLVKRALNKDSHPEEEINAGSNSLHSVRQVVNIVNNWTENDAGIEYLSDRHGEQKWITYPEPDEGYPYKFSETLLHQTIDSYRTEQ